MDALKDAVSFFDQIEHLRLECSQALGTTQPTQIERVFLMWQTLCEDLHETLQTEKRHAQHILVQQQVTYCTQLRAHEKQAQRTLKRLKQLWRHNLSTMELSLRKQQQTRLRMETTHLKTMKHLEQDFEETLQLNTTSSVPNSQLGTGDSRISMEKQSGAWASEYESSRESVCVQDVKQAITVLSRAKLIGDSKQLASLSRIIENDQLHQGDLIIQLWQLQQSKLRTQKSNEHSNRVSSFGSFLSEQDNDVKLEDILNAPDFLEELGLQSATQHEFSCKQSWQQSKHPWSTKETM